MSFKTGECMRIERGKERIFHNATKSAAFVFLFHLKEGEKRKCWDVAEVLLGFA